MSKFSTHHVSQPQINNDDLLNNSSILLVDDDKNICDILAEYLENFGVICTWTSISSEAVKLIETNEYDVIISDIYMPQLTGHDLLAITLNHHPITPVILMTGRPTLENTIDAIRLGAYDYLIKPFNLDVVYLTVSRALNYRHLAVQNRAYQENLEKQVQERTKELSDFLFYSVHSLSLALEARDPYTQGHGYRCGELLLKLAEELKIEKSHFTALRLAAELHDIGKIGIPDSILLKGGQLSPEEYEIMKDHVFIGYKILSPIPSLKEVSRYVYEHHERMDGKGYPRGLKGDEIHFHSRLLQVTEVCDALATPRSYKPAWPLKDIVEYFDENSGAAYDPEVVKALLALLNRQGDKIMEMFQQAVV